MAPVRVLHVLGRMNRGGAETWLMQILRTSSSARVRMEFVVTSPAPGEYDEEIRRLGSDVFPCPLSSSPVGFARRFLAVLRERGPYDVVHSHLHHFSGLVLALARLARVRTRIAHCHSDTSRADGRARVARRLYLRAMEWSIRRNATVGLAVSEGAAASLFGRSWRADPRWRVCHCGLDFSRFREPSDPASVRAELGVPAGAVVVGHVGRFIAAKNHPFLLRIAVETLRREPRAFFVLVGDGPLRRDVEQEAARLHLRERVLFTGVRADVPRLLRSFDVFLLPSLYEGLPLVGLEAQAAALPIVLSDTITREVDVVPGLLTWRSLGDPPQQWAESVVSAIRRRGGRECDPLSLLERSDFSVRESLLALEGAYGAMGDVAA